MRLIIFDKDFNTIGSIGVFNTLLWYRRYYSPGMFELHIPAKYFDLVNSGKYLYRNDRTELGVIREVNFNRGEKGQKTAYCKGYFSEQLLDNNVISPMFNQTGTPEALANSVIERYIINPRDTDRKIKHIRLGEAQGSGGTTTLQSTGDCVGERLYDMLRTQEMSQRLVFDYLGNTLVYEVWKGLDRRDTQKENSWAVFSDSFKNIKNAQYHRDESGYKNVAYVAGEEASRKIVEVDIRRDTSEERRELWVDARDLRQHADDVNYTDAQYCDLLYQRGLEKLADFEIVEKVDSDVDPTANLVYGVDFDLGDLCTYRYSDVNIECSKRITEIQEVFEGPKRTLSVVFGNDSARDLKKIIKREVM